MSLLRLFLTPFLLSIVLVVQGAEGISLNRPALFSPKEAIAFVPQTPKVNVVTGEYCEEECDLLVTGIEPLSINRFYNHFTGKDSPLYGHWQINPEACMLYNFEPIGGCNTFAAFGEENSSFFIYDKPIASGFQIDAAKNKSFTNFVTLLSGYNHPLNTKVSYTKGHVVRSMPGSLPADFYWWEGKIRDGSGKERFFKTDVRQWPQAGKDWPTRRSRHPVSDEITVEPLEFIPPYQAQITEERRPNGNIIRYEYEDINRSNPYIDHELPTTYLLKSIKAYSQKGVLLGSIDASYTSKYDDIRTPSQYIDGISFIGSDGRKAIYSPQQRPFNSRRHYFDTVLDHVEAAGKVTQSYQYRWDEPHTYQNAPFLYQVTSSEGRVFETCYDLGSKKVITQRAPVGPNGQMEPIARYEYQGNSTVFWDGENNKTIYRFNGDKRITAIEKYDREDKLYCVERFDWQDNTGNLLRRSIEDGQGKLYRLAEYVYDKNHNIIEEKIGDGKEHYTIYRTYSDDGFNLKLTESDREGRVVRFSYLPGTNLLSSELTYVNNHLLKRTFHFYDQEIGSVRVKTIIDDGKKENPYDLTGVTYRKITEIAPRRQLPCIGLPEVVQEKTIDAKGQEILLRKICYAYHPSGKVLREEHYDASGAYCFTISYEYDSKERLVATVDPLGNRIKREYDDNNNLKSLSGPRADMRKEWVYDKANRPIEERERQTDGTILVKEIQYDRLSRPKALIDECGNTTCYRYDALGKVIAIIHPDDSEEVKEYDVLGNLIIEKDGKDYNTERSYDYRGNLTKIVYPDGAEEQFTYDRFGRRVTHIDKNGALESFTYDIFDNIIETSVYSPEKELLKRTGATFSLFNKLSETDAEGVTTYLSYDYAGQKLSERKEERVCSYIYDALGRVHQTKRGDLLYIEEHDLLGRVTERRREDVNGALFRKENYTYDAAGNKTCIITSTGTTEMSYDTRGNILSKKDPLGNITTTTYLYQREPEVITTAPKGVKTITAYNWRGKVKSKTIKNPQDQVIYSEIRSYDRAGNQSTVIEKIYEGSTYSFSTIINRWFYGPMNRLEKQVESDIKTTAYAYDEKGRLQTITKPDTTQIHHIYDALGRVVRYYSTDIDYQYTYDKNDKLLSVYDAFSKTATDRSYDPYGNIIQEKLATGLIFRSTYDPYGKRTSLTLPDNRKIEYSYRGGDRYQVRFGDKICTYKERDLEGNPTTIALPGSIGEISIQRDKLSRWKEYNAPGYRAHFPEDSYDPDGNLCRYTFVDSLGEKSLEYGYDDLNQLIKEEEHTYAYDSLNNRLRKDQREFLINTLCQITEEGEKSYTYDANGNLLSDGIHSYTYDSLDRLIKIIKEKFSWIFFYDPFHRRLSVKEIREESPPSLPPIVDNYLWDGSNEIGMARRGSIEELRILGEGLGAEIGASLLIELRGEFFVPIHDHRGNIVTLLDIKNKNPVETYHYTAFGEQIAGGTLSPWRFSSKREDSLSGLIFFGRRYYSPDLGRWITPDPQGFADGPNLYAYLHNSPLIFADLYGLWSNPFADTRSFGDFISRFAHYAFSGVEMAGKHAVPFPGVRDVVESVGRFGAGGNFFAQSAHRQNYNRIHTIPGKQISHVSLVFGNGMGAPFRNAEADSTRLSLAHGGYATDLLYQGTQGMVTDFISCVVAKFGLATPGEQMNAHYFKNKLAEDPDHRFYLYLHSRGAARMINSAKLLTPEERSHIYVRAFGPETFVPQKLFGNAENYASKLDIVPMTSPHSYLWARFSSDSNVHFLSPTSLSPLKEHCFTGETYWKEIVDLADDFKKRYGI